MCIRDRFSAVTFFILIFPNLNFCPLYWAWSTHCSVLRFGGACSLALPSQPRCHSHHSHHWGTLMQQASPSLPLSSRMTCRSGWCLNFYLAFDFVTVCVLFFSILISICVGIRSWNLVLSWLCFFFDYVFIVGFIFLFLFFSYKISLMDRGELEKVAEVLGYWTGTKCRNLRSAIWADRLAKQEIPTVFKSRP